MRDKEFMEEEQEVEEEDVWKYNNFLKTSDGKNQTLEILI